MSSSFVSPIDLLSEKGFSFSSYNDYTQHSYTLQDAAVGVSKGEWGYNIGYDFILLLSKFMDAVEFVGKLKGQEKKVAVLGLVRGLVINYDEIKSTISHIIDLIVALYNSATRTIKRFKEVIGGSGN